MSRRDFLDTNVLVYAADLTYPAKNATARDLVSRAIAGEFIISPQVLAEFASVLLRHFSYRLSPADVGTLLESFKPIPITVHDASIVRRAVEAHATYGVHFYDGMIIAAAERGGCARIWSEDLNHDQKYFGVTVSNPF